MEPVKPTHMAVDLCDCSEIPGAIEADTVAGVVTVCERTPAGETRRTVFVTAGVRVVRRR